MPRSPRSTLFPNSAACVLLALASVGLPSDTRATPFEQWTGHPGAASLHLGGHDTEVDPAPVFGILGDEELLAGAMDSLLLEASGSALAPARDADSKGDPADAPSASNRPQLALAREQSQEGNFRGAAAALELAADISPDDATARAQLGSVLIPLGRVDEARRQLERALDLGGESARVYAALARVSEKQGHPEDAVRYYRKALQLDPDLVLAQNNLAWLLATSSDPSVRDPDEAIRLAQRALRTVPGEPPWILDTLAAAYAAAGRRDEAIRTAQRAEAQARKSGQPALADQIHEHLDHYLAGEPYVDSGA